MHTNLEKRFVLEGLKLGHRTDGRRLHEQRPLNFEFGTKDGHCVVRLGNSVACACITGTLERPLGGRPSEGSVTYRVKNVAKRGSKQRDVDIMMERFLDRSFKESKAIDLESLCVQAGRLVWHIQVNLTVMSDDGNVLDLLGYAALGACRVFKRPDVTIDRSAPGGVIVHPVDTKEGIPLTLHHFPVTTTFACCVFDEDNDDDHAIFIDPTDLEQATSHGLLMISVTPQGEVCAVQKADGCGMSTSNIIWCMRMGMDVAKNACHTLDTALKKHSVDRVAARVVRKRETGDVLVHRMTDSHSVPMDLESLPDSVQEAVRASKEPMVSLTEEDLLELDKHKAALEQKQHAREGHKEGGEIQENTSEWKQRRYAQNKPDSQDQVYLKASESIAKDAGDLSDDQGLAGALKKP